MVELRPHNYYVRLGNSYTRHELSKKLHLPTLKNSREGIYYDYRGIYYSILLFVTLDKTGKKIKNLHYNDFFEDDYFHWDSQNKQHINTPGIKKIISNENEILLFVRIKDKLKSKSLPYVYCGRIKYNKYEKGTSNPVHIIFDCIDFDELTKNEELKEIYEWNPKKSGKPIRTKVSMKGKPSTRRIKTYKKPNVTERSGLVTSRVGQGYYRQEILKKWNNKCGVTGISIKEILISSHIVPWSKSNEDERLDPENGILLSPNIDSLFDRHLISFKDSGKIIISNKLSSSEIDKLGVNSQMKLSHVSNGMKKYLSRHRKELKK